MEKLANLKGFGASEKYKGYKVIYLSEEVEDELTGLKKEVTFIYICINNYFFSPMVGKKVKVTLTQAPKLNNLLVCTGLELADKPVKKSVKKEKATVKADALF